MSMSALDFEAQGARPFVWLASADTIDNLGALKAPPGHWGKRWDAFQAEVRQKS